MNHKRRSIKNHHQKVKRYQQPSINWNYNYKCIVETNKKLFHLCVPSLIFQLKGLYKNEKKKINTFFI